MKYIVITKGLSNVINAKDENQVQKAITKLKKMGYKRPIVYQKK